MRLKDLNLKPMRKSGPDSKSGKKTSTYSKIQGVQKEMFILSGFEFLTLGEVL